MDFSGFLSHYGYRSYFLKILNSLKKRERSGWSRVSTEQILEMIGLTPLTHPVKQTF